MFWVGYIAANWCHSSVTSVPVKRDTVRPAAPDLAIIEKMVNFNNHLFVMHIKLLSQTFNIYGMFMTLSYVCLWLC